MRKKIKKSVAVLLCVIMTLASFSLATSAIANVFTAPDGWFQVANTKKNIAPGIIENEIIVNKADGQSQVMGYAVAVDVSAGSKTKIIAGYNNYDGTKWAMQSVRDQANKAEKARGLNIVAAFNADIFNMQTGKPVGPLVLNGNSYNSDCLGHPYFAVLNDGSVKIGSYLTQDVLDNSQEAVGGFYTLLENNVRTGYGSSDDPTLAPRTAIGIRADGQVVIYVADGRNYPISCGLNLYDLTSIMIGLGCVDVLNLDGGGSTTYAVQYEGSDNLVVENNPSDGIERKVSSTLFIASTASSNGSFDHASLAPNNEAYTPGSTVQFSAKGVDAAGGKAELPADGYFALASSSADLGEISASGEFTSNGTPGTVTVNYISGEAVCGSVSIEIVIPDTLYVPNSEVSLGFEDTTDFGIVAKWNNRDVKMQNDDIIWQIKGDDGADLSGVAGDFSGLTFTTKDGITVNANVTATLVCNSSATTQIRAIIGAMPTVIYDFEYTTDKAEADASDELEYIPSYSMPRFDRDIENSEGKNHYVQAAEFYEAGYPLYCWPNKSITDQDSMKATVVSKDSGEPVRFGDHSLRIDYNYATYNGSSNSNNYLRVTSPNYFFDGSPTALGCWVYVPEGTANFMLYLNCGNKNLGSNTAAYQPVTIKNGIDWTGWKYVEFDLSDTTSAQNAGTANAPYGFYQGCGVFWISYQPGGNIGDRTASTVYLDNIQLVYGANTDDIDNPEITSIRTDEKEIVDGETTFTSSVNTFKASYADVAGKYATGIDFSEVKMFVDGVDVTDKCYINEGDEEIYLYDAKLANGTHSIDISVSDKFGNTTTETRYFTVDAQQEATEVSLVPESASPVLGENYVLDIVANDDKVIGADVQLKILSYFVKYWNNYSVVAGDGYTLNGAASYDANNAVVSFSATRNADATSDNKTIAKVIFSIPTDVPEGLEVVYRIAKGALTLADGTSSFSGKITATCASPFIISTDTMTVGTAGGNIYVVDANTAAPIVGASIYTDTNELVGVTDDNGKAFTDKYISAVASYSIYAEKDGSRSFVYTTQSFPAGGSEDGMPTFVKLNATTDPSTMQSISWMASPVASASKATVLYALKADYDANGDSALVAFDGKSDIIEMSSSASVDTNYAVRINHATLTGLAADAEYVYKVGDGDKMSALKSFTTTRKGDGVNFFIIGDTQATDTTNTDLITKSLADSGVNYDFGIQTGDAVDNGGNYTMWANIANVFSGDFLSNQDLIQVLGNHEYYGDLTGKSAATYFDLPDTQNGAAPGCYSTQYGNVYVAVVNFASAKDYGKAAEWVKNDAAASTATWKILTMHQPSYPTNPSGNNVSVCEMFRALADEVKFDFVFSGHDHSYARTEPVKGGEVDENGTVYYICGSTGEKSYEIVPNDEYHFAVLDGEYNATYLTATATDTTFSIETHDYTSGGDVILDSYSKTKEVTCTENGHDCVYNNGDFFCGVCGYVLDLTHYTGFAKEYNTGKNMYFLGGHAQTGWFTFMSDYYYFDENGLGVTGSQTIDNVPYNFDDEGKQIGASFVTDSEGVTRCYRGGNFLKGWQQIDSDMYYFSSKGNMATGKTTVTVRTGQKLDCVFGSDGKLIKGAFYETPDGTKYYWGGELVSGWTVIDGEKYYFDPVTNIMAKDTVEIDGQPYAFDMDGIYVHEGAHDWDIRVNLGSSNCKISTFRVYRCNVCHKEKVVVLDATDHVDENGDGLCDVCGNLVSVNKNTPKAIFTRIIESIKAFFQKIIDFFKFGK